MNNKLVEWEKKVERLNKEMKKLQNEYLDIKAEEFKLAITKKRKKHD